MSPSPYDPSEGLDTGIFTQADACHDHRTSQECRTAGCYEKEFGEGKNPEVMTYYYQDAC